MGETEIKREFLWPLSVWKKIKIKQTRRTKSLYTQLIIFLDNKPYTFYPQGYGKKEITIKQFLENLIKGKLLCLHEAFELEENLKLKR